MGLGQARAEDEGWGFPTVEVTELTVGDPEKPDLARLSVSIKKLEVADLQIVPARDDESPDEYFWNGQKLPAYDFWGPGCTMVTRFELRWGGREIPVADRFWNDLPRLRLRKILLPDRPLDEEEKFAYIMQQRENTLSLKISEHGGTVLISWQRPEE